jgi:excisionase family DNA binding protein
MHSQSRKPTNRKHPAQAVTGLIEQSTEPMLLRKQEVAHLLQISVRTLEGFTNSGEIPCVRLGRSIRYRLDSVERAIQSLETANGTLR